MKRTFALAAMVLACAAGCMSTAQRREEDLVVNARQWNDDFRWARWHVLGQSMLPEENALFQERCNLVDEDLVIADYELTGIRFLQQSQAAIVEVTLHWYRKSDPTVRHASLEQRWEQRTGRWLMIKQRRVRGDRFPLVPEPAEKGAQKTAAAAESDTASRPGSP